MTTANVALRKRLRSANVNRYEPLTTQLKFGKRCFLHVGPKAWNTLPSELTDHSAFRHSLKSFLFERTFSDSLATGQLGVSDGQSACASAGIFSLVGTYVKSRKESVSGLSWLYITAQHL